MWTLSAYDQLTPRQIFDLFKLRMDVFVVEQACIYPDIDADDLTAYHGLAYDGDILLGYFRIIPTAHKVKIGRVVIHPAYRGRALGRQMLEEAICYCRDLYPHLPPFVQAQAYLQAFYASLGFVPLSEVYAEDGIDHIDMMLPLDTL